MYWLNLFTWWLYISFILYFYKLNPFNPYPFYIGIVFRDILFIILNFRNPKPPGFNSMFTSVFKFILLLLVHYIPLYYLYKSNKKQIDKKKKIKKQNTAILFYVFLLLLYLIYINNNNFTITYMYSDNFEKIYANFSEYIYGRFNSYYEFIIIISIVLFMSYKILNKKY